MDSGYDNFHTYFESNIKLNDVPNIFIHGVGLNNTMWKPQKKYFKNESTIYYDLLNHGKSKKGFKDIKFENFNNQLIQLIDYTTFDINNLLENYGVYDNDFLINICSVLLKKKKFGDDIL